MQVFKEKLGVDFQRYHIIGVCNPRIAHAVLVAGGPQQITRPQIRLNVEEPPV